ncbi:MAG: ATP-grasp domain-containing protein [Planctomycetota bacterium]
MRQAAALEKTRSTKNVLVIGASQRALIPGLIAADFNPIVMDLFADWDTQDWQVDGTPIRVILLSQYSDVTHHNLASIADCAIVGGGCELHNDVMVAIAKQIPIAGCQPDHLREFARLSNVLQKISRAGCPVPEQINSLNACQLLANANDVAVLRKPESSCGGSKIEFVDQSSPESVRIDWQRDHGNGVFWQHRVDGTSHSALLSTNNSKTHLIGVTRQLVGVEWLGAKPFAYCGSIGPLGRRSLDSSFEFQEASVSLKVALESSGQMIGQPFGMSGVWGFDFLSDQSSRPSKFWIVDVNARVPASAELFDASFRSLPPQAGNARSVVEYHLSASANANRASSQTAVAAASPMPDPWNADSMPIEGKAILFNRLGKTITISETCFCDLVQYYDQEFFLNNDLGMSLADLPKIGTTIEPGQPILTIRLRKKRSGDESALIRQIEEELQQQAVAVERVLSADFV